MPSINISPSVGSISLFKCLIKVDFPDPDKPIQTKVSPSSIFKETKILSGTNANNRNFSLLGDPALKLAYPRYKIQTTSIQDTLNALMEVTINGEIQNEDSVRLYDFWSATKDEKTKKDIIEYNEEDCVSTFHLRDFLVSKSSKIFL